MKTRTPRLRRTLRTGLLAAGLAAVIGTAALAPAMADEDDWHRGDRDRHEQVWRDRDNHDRDRDRDWHRAYAAPGYAYYPAPGYYGYGYSYAPAPTYAAPGLSLGFVFR